MKAPNSYFLKLSKAEPESIVPTIQVDPPAMAPYTYSPVNTDAKEIRLLQLLPGNFTDPVIIFLSTDVLTDNHIPEFEALSYTWGSARDPLNISLVQGVSPSAPAGGTLDVTQNLATLLPYLRYQAKPRTLWIDAICINQQNVQERSQQIQRMRDIYQMAARVVVWLGPESHDSAFPFKTLERLTSHVNVDWARSLVKPGTIVPSEAHWADFDTTCPFDDKIWDALNGLLSRSWFERLWIWQEIRLAKKDALVCCGHDAISWKYCFAPALFCLYHKPSPPRAARTSIDQAYRLCSPILWTPLVRLLEDTKNCKCSDPRDRVYALLGLNDESMGSMDIMPDYSKTEHEVYKDVVLHALNDLKRLDLLVYCEIQDPPKKPTWVCDWSVTIRCKRFLNSWASGWSKAEYRIHGDFLQVMGVGIDIVVATSDLTHLGTTVHSELLAAIKILQLSQTRNDEYVCGGTKFEAFYRTLGGNSFSDGFVPSNPIRLDFGKVQAFMATPIASRDSKELEMVTKYLNLVSGYCTGRVLFRTQTGRMGLAPKLTQAGDRICVVLGCDAPLILRPTTPGRWLVVGGCYCHGLMNAEGLLGPLPGAYQRVARLEPVSGDYYWNFIDRDTGHVEIDNPRLGPLPKGWQLTRHDMDHVFNLYACDDEEESKTTELMLDPDPRFRLCDLIERGVNLTTFGLE